MKLIDEWKHAWKMFSVQANVLGAALVGGYTQLPQEFKDVVPHQWVLWIAALTFVAGGLGRLVKQDSLQPKDPAEGDPK